MPSIIDSSSKAYASILRDHSTSGYRVNAAFPMRTCDDRDMPLTGEYEPSTSRRTRKQTELYEATNGAKGGNLRGRPVIVLTSVGAKTGKLRTSALMRVEHEGVYAVVASSAALRSIPTGTTTSRRSRTSSCRTARPRASTRRARSPATRRRSGGSAPSPHSPATPSTRPRRTGRSRCSCSRPCP